MAKKEVIESDISGKPDAATVTFGLEDEWYEIDLTDDEKKKLQSALRSYLTKGRKAAPKQPEKKPLVPETTAEERANIRAWGRENGFQFAEAGRIPKGLQAAYDKAHNIDRGSLGGGTAATERPGLTVEEREKIRALGQKVRAWGRENGFQVSDAGRIPKDLQAAYDKAHKNTRGK